mmetsp:Transcript_118554/g.382729  ORF Transcript_118554/g.382729 Transcript_118554/m.382729 type:complete len:432 (+) Transcript_118554:95-1390(+)
MAPKPGKPKYKASARVKGQAEVSTAMMGATRITKKRPAAALLDESGMHASAVALYADEPAVPSSPEVPAAVPKLPPESPDVAPHSEHLPQPTLVRALAGHGLVARCGAVVPFPIRAACVFPGGSRLITSGEDGTARVWDAASGEQLVLLNCHRAGVLGTVVFKDGHRVLTTGADGTACVWDIDKGMQVARLEGHSTPVTGGAVYPSGERVITMGLDGSGRIWDIRTQRIIAPLAGVGKTVVGIFPDGDHVIVASEKGQAEVWYGRTGELVTEIRGHKGAINAMAIFPDGSRVLTAGEDGCAAVWDAKKGGQLARLAKHGDALLCGAVSPCGRQVLTGGRDGAARLSDAADGRTLSFWVADGRGASSAGSDVDCAIHACAFLPDGKRVLLAGAVGARIWRLPQVACSSLTAGDLDPMVGPLSSAHRAQVDVD